MAVRIKSKQEFIRIKRNWKLLGYSLPIINIPQHCVAIDFLSTVSRNKNTLAILWKEPFFPSKWLHVQRTGLYALYWRLFRHEICKDYVKIVIFIVTWSDTTWTEWPIEHVVQRHLICFMLVFRFLGFKPRGVHDQSHFRTAWTVK